MAALGIDTITLSQRSGIPYPTLRRRLRGEAGFTLEEAIYIHKVIGQNLTLEELFERDF